MLKSDGGYALEEWDGSRWLEDEDELYDKAPGVNEPLDHHIENGSRPGSFSVSPVAPNRKPGIAKKTDNSISVSVDEVKRNINYYRNGDRQIGSSSIGLALQGLSKLFKMKYKGRSRYANYEVKLGRITFRLSDHNAMGDNFVSHDYDSDKYVSVYIEGETYPRKPSTVNYTEIRYPKSVFESNPRGVVDSIVEKPPCLSEV